MQSLDNQKAGAGHMGWISIVHTVKVGDPQNKTSFKLVVCHQFSYKRGVFSLPMKLSKRTLINNKKYKSSLQ